VNTNKNIAEKPRLLHVLVGAGRGGVERDALVLMERLLTVRHDAFVLGPDGPMTSDWKDSGAVVHIARQTSRWPLQISPCLKKYLERLKANQRLPDAAIVWHGMPKLPQILHLLSAYGIRTAIHGGNPAIGLSRLTDWVYCMLHRLYPPKGELPNYICCSKHVADSFHRSRYLRRFPTEVVPNGIEWPQAPADVKSVRTDKPFTIGMTARLSRIKDHATLLQAFAELRESLAHNGSQKSVRLELIGDGDQRGVLVQLCEDLNLNDSVRFVGEVDDVYGAMAEWDLFAYATTKHEGLGNAVSEAMAFGLPCVLTDVGPIRDFFDLRPDGPSVRLVPPFDSTAMASSLSELITDQAARFRLALAGQDLARERFHPDHYSRAYAELLGLPTGA